jgi:phage terminase small subunit
MMDKDLNKRQEIFVQHYVRTNNAAESARLAGYSENGAKQYGSQLLQNKHVKQAIEELRREQDLTMQAQFRTGAMRAFHKLMEIIDDPEGNAMAQLHACKDILDRAGYKAAIKTENSIEVSYLDRVESIDTKLAQAFVTLDEQRAAETDIINAD